MKWLLLALLVLIFLNFSNAVYFNIFTHSLPFGIYIKKEGIPQRGDYAASCLTVQIARYGINRGYLTEGNCDTGTVRVLKIIKGVPGDRFVVKNGFLELNSIKYPIKKKDSLGRELKCFYPQQAGALKRDEYMLISTFVPNSWDSRYWGPVTVQFLLKPWWIWDHEE